MRIAAVVLFVVLSFSSTAEAQSRQGLGLITAIAGGGLIAAAFDYCSR